MRGRGRATAFFILTAAACGGDPPEDPVPADPSNTRVGESDGSGAHEPADQSDAQVGESDGSGDDAREREDVPTEWPRVQGSCGVSLQAPSLIAQAARGVDSCVAAFTSPGCTYSVDLGGFSDPLNRYGAPDYVVESVRVAGRIARMVTSNGASGADLYFVGIHFPAPLWPGGHSVSATIVARCTRPEAQAIARLVLQSVELPASDRESSTKPEETTRCVGDDIRPVTGYRLGRPCVEAKLEVPGTCALGAKINGATGHGPMVCFVSTDGDYYWGHVAYGETIAGTGSRNGGGEVIGGSQLTPEEDARCKDLVAMLGEPQEPLHGGDLSYQVCP